MTSRARILAGKLAANAVRKECSALRRLLKRKAGADEIAGFYRGFATFLSDTLVIPLQQAQSECRRHIEILEVTADKPVEERLSIVSRTADHLADLTAAGDAPRDTLGL